MSFHLTILISSSHETAVHGNKTITTISQPIYSMLKYAHMFVHICACIVSGAAVTLLNIYASPYFNI